MKLLHLLWLILQSPTHWINEIPTVALLSLVNILLGWNRAFFGLHLGLQVIFLEIWRRGYSLDVMLLIFLLGFSLRVAFNLHRRPADARPKVAVGFCTDNRTDRSGQHWAAIIVHPDGRKEFFVHVVGDVTSSRGRVKLTGNIEAYEVQDIGYISPEYFQRFRAIHDERVSGLQNCQDFAVYAAIAVSDSRILAYIHSFRYLRARTTILLSIIASLSIDLRWAFPPIRVDLDALVRAALLALLLEGGYALYYFQTFYNQPSVWHRTLPWERFSHYHRQYAVTGFFVLTVLAVVEFASEQRLLPAVLVATIVAFGAILFLRFRYTQ